MFEELKENIQQCRFCTTRFGFEPNPVVFGKKQAKIVQISQAPSQQVHKSGKPFTDMSGKKLKYDWYQITDEEFYNQNNFFIGALAHCYPGKDKNGNDRFPPKCCFERWVRQELSLLDNEIYILIGAKAAKVFFPDESFESLVFKDNYWNNKLAIVLPHPSPLNKRWLKEHPTFLANRIFEVRSHIRTVLYGK